MGLFSSIFKGKVTDRTAGSGYRFPFGQSIAGKTVNERSAMQISAVNAAVRILAESIANGSIPAQRLEGMIDVLKTRLSSTVSNWYTDADGNLILESVNGASAMKLCGEGFMIASARTDDGAWDWRTFGTGDGFTADMLITGFLSSDRIQAGSITVNKLASDVGEELDLSSDKGINLRVEGINANINKLREAAVSQVQVLYRLNISSASLSSSTLASSFSIATSDMMMKATI